MQLQLHADAELPALSFQYLMKPKVKINGSIRKDTHARTHTHTTNNQCKLNIRSAYPRDLEEDEFPSLLLSFLLLHVASILLLIWIMYTIAVTDIAMLPSMSYLPVLDKL